MRQEIYIYLSTAGILVAISEVTSLDAAFGVSSISTFKENYNDLVEMAQTVRDGDQNQTILAFDEIREELIQVEEGNGNLNDAICDVCFIRTLSSVGVNNALYLCYKCITYLCQDCFKGHESHRFIKKSERDGQIESFLDEMRNENKSESRKMFDREEVSYVDRVNVKHALDKNKDYVITGLCGLDDTSWVVCDSHNCCIKVFSIGSHILQRYIRFRSRPFGITEIKFKREPTEQGVMPASVSSDIKVKQLTPFNRLRNAINTFFSVKREPTEQVVMTTTDISVPNQSKPDKQCLQAVTFPWKRKILIINLTQTPAVITKSINTEKRCFSIDFSEGEAKIFTVCTDYEGSVRGSWFVSVMSTDGVTIKTINTYLQRLSIPYLAVCPGRVYITDRFSDKVLCMNDEGKEVSQTTIAGLGPEGIVVDHETNNIYICSLGHHELYRLDSSLKSLEYLFDLESVDSEKPVALCLYRDRLYVGHNWSSTHKNFVTVVRVL